MTSPRVSGVHSTRRFRRSGRLPRLLAVTSLVAVSVAVAALPERVTANPANVPGPAAITATGPFSGTVPDGACAVEATVRGGAGGSAIGVSGANGAGAAITATYAVLPGQSYSGVVGGGGQTVGNVSSPGGSNGGGPSGTVSGGSTIHPGGGGGGWSGLDVAGQSLIVAGGGGGSGGGHATNGGFGGNGGLPGGSGVTAGSDGQDGFDNPTSSPGTPGGGGGGQAAAPGAGGVHTDVAARNGSAGSGQNGGQGGPDTTPDSGGGGGGGVFGGGGGASTVGNGSGGQTPGGPSGAGGGGGSSFVASTSPDGATPVAGVSSAPGPKLPSTGNGAAGRVDLEWVPCDYDLAVTKSAAPATVAPGDTVTWTVTITNLGPDPMTQGDTVTLTDTLPGAGAKTITAISTAGGDGGPLASPPVTCSAAVGATMPATLTCDRPYSAPGAPGAPSGGVRGLDVDETLTITYTQVAQAADEPGLENTATVTDRATGDTNDTDDAEVTVFEPDPAIDLDKQAGSVDDLDDNGHDAGDTIDYTFVVTNTGNVPLTSVGVDDPKVGAVSCPPGPLAPTDERTCTASYTITQADIDAGTVDNTATASGTPPSGPPVTDEDETTTPLTRTPGIELDKQAGSIDDVDDNGPDAGDTIAYTFVVTNTGNVTLDPVAVSDPMVGAVSCPPGGLAGGATRTCTATYTLTQDDVDAGTVDNTATVSGTPPTGPPVTDEDETTTSVTRTPDIALDKQAGTVTDLDANGSDAGDTIAYTFLVTNTGNVTLDPVSVSDPTVGAVSCPPGSLAPGATRTCTATYTLTQVDVDSGHVANTASATGTPPSGPPPVAEDSTDTPVPTGPAISLDKQAGDLTDVDGNGDDVGDTIDYTFVVVNTGNVTLDPVTVSDPKVGAVTCPPGALAPGASRTCTAAGYALTQADVDAGTVDNTATASGTPPTGPAVTDDDDTTTPVTRTPGIALDKQADADGPVGVGDEVTFTFVVTNTGNVTLTDVQVEDPMLGAVICAATTLAPGEHTSCSAPPYAVTSADVREGSIVNSATASADGGGGVRVDSEDRVEVATTSAPDPGIELVKRADTDGPVRAGDVVTYTFTVTNTGNVTLTHVQVEDPMLRDVTCKRKRLEPGQSTTCKAPAYTVGAADVRDGDLVNTASVTADACAPELDECVLVDDADTVRIPTAATTGTLPDTGSTMGPLLPLAGLGLLGLGSALLVVGRRSRKAAAR